MDSEGDNKVAEGRYDHGNDSNPQGGGCCCRSEIVDMFPNPPTVPE